MVSGASANDPTTVGSLAVVGATTGYGLAWLVVLLLPMLSLIQAIAASVAAVSQMSLQQAIVQTYGRVPAIVAAGCVVVISIFTLGADVQAAAEALRLILGVPLQYFVIPIVVIAGWMLATKSYLRIERVLAAFTLIFLCYVAAAILKRPDWSAVVRSIIVPHVELSARFITGALALLGTTLTSYVYFWESIGVAERKPQRSELATVNIDAVVGMLVAGSSFLFILIGTAATASNHGAALPTVTDAAAALQPLAGGLFKYLFGVGLLASAAVAIPVIAATNGYVVAQTVGAPAGLNRAPREAVVFYGVIFASLAMAAALALTRLPTIKLLYWVSVAGGLATPVTLGFMLLLARNPKVMHDRPVTVAVAAAGWTVTGIVTLASFAFIVLTVRG